MEVNFFHKNLSKQEIQEIGNYFSKKRERIESLITKFAEDAQILNLTIEKFDKHAAYQADMRLVLLSKTLVAKEASHDITKALDLATDRLIIQIKKFMDGLRNLRSHQSIRKEDPIAKLEPKI